MQPTPSNSLPSLPETAQIIADVIGRDATLKLAAVARHRAVYVPKKLIAGHWIIAVLGREKADVMAKEFGGMLLTLAKCTNIARHARDRKIYRAKKAGMRDAQIATEVGVTTRTVRNVLARLKQARICDK